jgi:transcription elongation GreA/GreB family factor
MGFQEKITFGVEDEWVSLQIYSVIQTANEAAKLGDISHRSLMGAALDRYLVKSF